jgi:alpha-glucosidase (family GH31 glycosyl hydrolase)
VIRHRPFGRGHPYVVDPDQRFPAHPAAGAAFDLGITTDAGARGVELQVESAGARRTFPMRPVPGGAVPVEHVEWGAAAGGGADGHLAAVEAVAAEPGRSAWTFRHEGLDEGKTIRYRFAAAGMPATGWFELAACAWRSDGGTLDVVGHAGRLLPETTWLGDGTRVYAVRFALRLEPGERVVGFGERFDGVDQRGRRLESVVFDQYKAQGARSYLPMPFAIVAGGDFGFFVDTGHSVRFDVGASRPDRLLVEVDLRPGEPAPTVALHLYSGRPAEVLTAFLDQVGVPAEPPAWIYRLWMSGNEWNTQARVAEEVARSFDEGIPVGAVVVEAWSDEETFAEFDGQAWPDPKGLVEALHELDVKVLLWQIPLVKAEAAVDSETMVERGYCVHDEHGEPYRNPGGWFNDALLLDVTNEEAVQWWTERRRYLVEEIGVDGFKTDGGEHAWPASLWYANGTRGGETNNRYPVLYAKAYHDLLRSAGRDPVTFSRAGYVGSQRYPAHWAGDADSTWEAFRASISAGLTASACGVTFWSFDLGGFSGPLPTPELYLRSAAFAALCPIMQYHSEFNFHRSPSRDRTPWNVAEQSGDQTVIPTFRRFVQQRERLVGYLVDEAREAIRARRPLMRALFFDSDDERIWRFPYEYLLGDALLVAPVVEEGATSHEVFLPRGEWIDPETGDVQQGSRVVERACPLDHLPVLVRAEAAGLVDRLSLTPIAEVR